MQKNTAGKEVGTYGVREVGIYHEKVLHAPKATTGRFALVVFPDGSLFYQPVHP